MLHHTVLIEAVPSHFMQYCTMYMGRVPYGFKDYGQGRWNRSAFQMQTDCHTYIQMDSSLVVALCYPGMLEKK